MTAPDPTILAAAIKCAEEDLHLQRDIDAPEVNKVRALVAAASAYQRWQPIETAPKDGTPLLLGTMESEETAAVSTLGWWQDAEDDGRDTKGADGGFVDHAFNQFYPGRSFGKPTYQHAGKQPTHWMPLPAPPIERAEREPILEGDYPVLDSSASLWVKRLRQAGVLAIAFFVGTVSLVHMNVGKAQGAGPPDRGTWNTVERVSDGEDLPAESCDMRRSARKHVIIPCPPPQIDELNSLLRIVEVLRTDRRQCHVWGSSTHIGRARPEQTTPRRKAYLSEVESGRQSRIPYFACRIDRKPFGGCVSAVLPDRPKSPVVAASYWAILPKFTQPGREYESTQLALGCFLRVEGKLPCLLPEIVGVSGKENSTENQKSSEINEPRFWTAPIMRFVCVVLLWSGLTLVAVGRGFLPVLGCIGVAVSALMWVSAL